jgi:hypothetical protein
LSEPLIRSRHALRSDVPYRSASTGFEAHTNAGNYRFLGYLSVGHALGLAADESKAVALAACTDSLDAINLTPDNHLRNDKTFHF